MRSPGLQLIALALALAAAGGHRAPAQPAAAAAPEHRIPPRPADAESGSQFATRTTGWGGRQRQAAAVAELVRGNLPEFLRRLAPIELTADIDGAALTATLWVMPDYLAVGGDDDFLRMPLTYPAATRVASRLGFVLPTRKIVDAVYAAADLKLEPRPMPPGPRMRSIDYYRRHHRTIETQRAGRPLGELVAGHKKDVVITKRLRRNWGRIAIYGWHREPGKPIQPLSTVHGGRYADYSHGVRLVHPMAWIDGRPRPIVELLADPKLSALVSYEGPIPDAAALLDPRRIAAESP